MPNRAEVERIVEETGYERIHVIGKGIVREVRNGGRYVGVSTRMPIEDVIFGSLVRARWGYVLDSVVDRVCDALFLVKRTPSEARGFGHQQTDGIRAEVDGGDAPHRTG